MEESGLPGFRSITWFALAAPPGTPAPLVAKINRDTVEVLKDPQVSERLHQASARSGRHDAGGNGAILRRRAETVGQGDHAAHISVQ